MKFMKLLFVLLAVVFLTNCSAPSKSGSGLSYNAKLNYQSFMTHAKDYAKNYEWIKAAEEMENSLDLHETGEGYYLAGIYYIKASINTENKFIAKSYYKKGRKYLKIAANDFNYKPAEKVIEDSKVLKAYE